MKRFLRFLFPALALSILIFVWSVSISNNGGIAATFQTISVSVLVYNLFKLAGLTAFTLVALQVLTGPYMHLWEKLYGPKFYRYHGYQGIFALLFAITHWFLITLYLKLIHVGVLQFDRNNFPLPEFITFYFGPLALVIMLVTVTTAALSVLWDKPWFQKVWRKLHYANYLIFILVYLHSRKVGTDVGPLNSPLHFLWDVFLLGTIGGLIYRHVYVPHRHGPVQNSNVAKIS